MDSDKIDTKNITKEYVLDLLGLNKDKNEENGSENTEHDKIIEYINKIDTKTLHALLIAHDHLGTSFDIVKSIDFNK